MLHDQNIYGKSQLVLFAFVSYIFNKGIFVIYYSGVESFYVDIL